MEKNKKRKARKKKKNPQKKPQFGAANLIPTPRFV